MRTQRRSETVSEHESDGKEGEIIAGFLQLVNEGKSKADLVRASIKFFQEKSGCEAVGIRLREADSQYSGHPIMERARRSVIQGRFEPSNPSFSPKGSFWTNSMTELLAVSTETDRQVRTRCQCNGEGYESVALIALRAGDECLGLLQINDRQKDRFSSGTVAFWERLAGRLAVALARFEKEENLRKSEEEYRSLFENMPNGFAYCKILFEGGEAKDFTYLRVNSAFETLTGLRNVAGKRVSEVIPGFRESQPKLFEICERVALTGDPEQFEICVDPLRGMWFTVSAYSPKRGHFVTVFDVITDRKRAEERMTRLASFPEMNPNPILEVDVAGEITFFNPATRNVLKNLGYDEKDCAVLLPEDLRTLLKEWDKKSEFIANREVSVGNRSFDETVHFIPHFNAVRIYAADITERKEAEESLRTNERKLQTLMDAAPAGISWTDSAGSIIYCNRKFTDLFGYTLEDIPTIDDWRMRAYPDRRYRDSLRPLVPAIIEARRQGKDVEPMEVMVTCKDGSARWVAQTGALASDLNVAIYTDVAERKKAELSLRESENKFRNLAEKSVVGIYLMQNGVFRYVNSRFAEIHGYEADELIDKKGPQDTVFPEDLPKVLKKGESGETLIRGEFRIVTKQGEMRDVEIYGALTTYRGKKAVVGTLLDVSERKATEEALRWKTAFLEALLHTSLDGIRVMNDHGKTILQNQRSVELWKIPQDIVDKGDDEAQARHVLSMVKDPDRFREAVHYFLSHPDGCVGDEVELKDGRIFDRYSSPVVGRDGTYYGRIWGFHDITEQRRTAQARVRLLAELESKNAELEAACCNLKESQKKMLQQEKMASIGQLAAGVAHEINNPMGFIMSNLNSLRKYMTRIPEFIEFQSDALLNGTSRDEVAEKRKALKIDYLLEDTQSLIKESLEGADRVKRIVYDLKNFSRVDQMELAQADINRVLDSTLNIVWNELKHKATVTKDYGEIPSITCNAGQLSQVFMNILVNGAQAITGFGEITITTRLSGERVLIVISDTGCGIPEEKLSRIFEPFFTTKEIGQGTGLGLSIAYDIVKKHGGEIDVVSEVGKGTTFTVVLPLEGDQHG